MKKSCGIILAAGKGTRMGTPYPKVLAPLHGKPLIHWVIERMQGSGVDNMAVVIGHQAEMVQKSVEEAGYTVEFVHQIEQLGTGHAVKTALAKVPADTDTILVTYGDMPFISANLLKGLAEKQQRLNAAVVLSSVFFNDPMGPAFGRVIRDVEGAIIKIVEQKVCTEEQLKIKECNAGPVAYDAQWVRGALSKVPLNENGEYYLTDLAEIARADGRLVESVKITESGHAHGINTQTHLQEAHEIAAL